MEIFDVFSMNGIENYPAAGEIFLENVILKVSQTHFPKDFYPKGGHKFFKGGGGCEVPWHSGHWVFRMVIEMQVELYISAFYLQFATCTDIFE